MSDFQQPDLSTYTDKDIQSFLRSYELMVKGLPDLAHDWEEMDDFERQHARTVYFAEGWAPRRVLGALYLGGRLTAEQEKALGALDNELIQHLDNAHQCYDLNLQDIADLFTWGTPLAQSEEIIHLPVRPRELNDLAAKLATESQKKPA